MDRHRFAVLRVIMLCTLCGSALAQTNPQWSQFLGPSRDGKIEQSGLLSEFGEQGPSIRWRTRGGVGMSGFAASGKLLYTMVQDAGGQYLLGLNITDGSPAFRTRIAPAYKNGQGDGPRATPTVAGDSVIVFTGEGVLASVHRSSGDVQWSNPILKELVGRPAEYGMACSPLVVDDQIVLSVGAPDAAVVAVSKGTGKIQWTAGQSRCGYSSPSLLKVGDQRQIVAFMGNEVLGISTKGKQLWSYRFVTDYNCNTASAISIGGNVLVSAGENQGSVLLSIDANQKVTEVWDSLGPKASMRSEWQTPILSGNYLYGFDNVGSAGPISHLVCVDARSGQQVWRQTRFGKGNLIAADGKLIMSTMKGELVLAEIDHTGYKELARARVIGSTRQAPALIGKLAVLRDNSEIVCVDLAK